MESLVQLMQTNEGRNRRHTFKSITLCGLLLSFVDPFFCHLARSIQSGTGTRPIQSIESSMDAIPNQLCRLDRLVSPSAGP